MIPQKSMGKSRKAGKEKPSGNQKKRNWAMVMYPDSMPDDWYDIMCQVGIPFAVSPIHDQDKNPDGTLKKPHYHVIMCWPGPTTFDVARSVTEKFHAPIPQPIESVEGAYKYLTHAEHPDKAQYDKSDIIHVNGFNPREYIQITAQDVLSIKIGLTRMINEQRIVEYSELIERVLEGGDLDEYDVASSHTFYFNRYISSKRALHEALIERERKEQAQHEAEIWKQRYEEVTERYVEALQRLEKYEEG